jgi:hypothetical protein
MSISRLGGSRSDEGGSLPLDRSLVRSRLHQEHPVTLAGFFQRRGSRSLPTCPVKEHALPRPEMPSFGGRWSAAPPYGGSPFGCAKEPSTNGRRCHGFCHPGPTRRRPSLEQAPHRHLAMTMKILFRASPCPRAFCGVPYGRPEKAKLLWTTTFRPNSATRIDARARPYTGYCSSPARAALDRACVTLRSLESRGDPA